MKFLTCFIEKLLFGECLAKLVVLELGVGGGDEGCGAWVLNTNILQTERGEMYNCKAQGGRRKYRVQG